MTIGTYRGEASVTCDGCEDELTESELEVEGFEELLAAIRGDGWLVRKEGDTWRHYCPDCQG